MTPLRTYVEECNSVTVTVIVLLGNNRRYVLEADERCCR